MAGDPVCTSSPWHSCSISWMPAYMSFMAVCVADCGAAAAVALAAEAVAADDGGMLAVGVDEALDTGELSHVAVMGRCICVGLVVIWVEVRRSNPWGVARIIRLGCVSLCVEKNLVFNQQHITCVYKKKKKRTNSLDQKRKIILKLCARVYISLVEGSRVPRAYSTVTERKLNFL